MMIRVNGKERDVADGTTVEALLDGLGIKAVGIAVDLNKEIVTKRLYAETVLRQGDAVEVVRMTGGG